MIKDDAVTFSTININSRQRIFNIDVGLLIRDPRVSDLAITLIAPTGQTWRVPNETSPSLTTEGLPSLATQAFIIQVP